MELLEALRNIAIREGFEAGHSLQEEAEETGLAILEVLQREIDLKLLSPDDVSWRLHLGPH